MQGYNTNGTNGNFSSIRSFTTAASAGTVDVEPVSVTRSAASVAAGASLTVTWGIRNNGTATAVSSNSQVRITNSSSSPGTSTNNVGTAKSTGSISAGQTVNQSSTFTVPSLAPGTYYAWVVADNNNPPLLNQSNVGNDYAKSASFTITAPAGTVDVEPVSVTRSAASVAAGASLTVTWGIRNNGTATAVSSNSQVRITNSSSSPGNSTNNVGTAKSTGSISAGQTVNQSSTFTVPSLAPGTYYAWVVADNNNPPLLNQSNVGNDYAKSASFTITAPAGPLSILTTTPTNSTVWYAGNSATVSWTTGGNTTQIQYFRAFYSLNGGTTFSPIGSSVASDRRSLTWQIPSQFESTTARIRVVAYNSTGGDLV